VEEVQAELGNFTTVNTLRAFSTLVLLLSAMTRVVLARMDSNSMAPASVEGSCGVRR